MAGEKYNGAGSVHALLARLTKLDATGAPAVGPDNVLWTDALSKLAVGVNLNETDAIKQPNGAGGTCLLFQAPPTIDSLQVDSFAICTPDPLIKEFLVGGDIIVDALSEIQQIAETGGATGGTFTLSAGATPTSALPYNATATQIRDALNAIIPAGVTVTGGPLPGSPVTVKFKDKTNVAQLTANSAGLTPSGTVTVSTTTPGGPTSTPPKAIGYAAPRVGVQGKPNGVALELWSRAIVGSSQVGYFHWLFPRVSLAEGSDGFEFNGEDPLTPTFTGTGSENVGFGGGADGLWPYISDRVYQYVQESTLPSFVNGYATLTTP